MVIYSVTIGIEADVHDEWLHWMRKTHVPDVLATNLITGYRILRLQNEADNGITYNFQYTLRDMDDYERYQSEFAPALQADVKRLYEGKFVAFRTVLDLVEEG